MILSFDTSNYTTSACLFDAEQGIVWQNRFLLHPPAQQKGLRQSDVVFLHTKNFETLLDGMPKVDIDAVVASSRPRPVEGSYMPCFLVGKNYGAALAKVLSCPFKTFSHQENHIMAALYSGKHMQLLQNEFLALHISGGTSDVLSVSAEQNGLKIDTVGGSNDLHAGQLIDRIGVMLGMQFPCGKEIEKRAGKCNEEIRIRPAVRENIMHFSGFENKAKQLIEQKSDPAFVAKFALECVLQTLSAEISGLRQSRGEIPILLAGGVMSNRYIHQKLSERFDELYFSDPFFSSDHALGNAVLYNFLQK